MLALAGQKLAAAGWHVTLPDLGGTGDSFGELREARVADWLDDLTDAAAAANVMAPVKAVLAIRLGACLAASLLPRLPDIRALVLWQPVSSGESHLTQFLRVRVVGSGLSGTESASVAGLRSRLAGGETLEVAGYDISPALAQDLDALRFAPPVGSPLPQLHWLEVSSASPPALGRLASDCVRQWKSQGGEATAQACVGEPFWATTEPGLAEQLLLLTVAALVGVP
jgi:exosortase A-associated hydrolase 2